MQGEQELCEGLSQRNSGLFCRGDRAWERLHLLQEEISAVIPVGQPDCFILIV